MTLLAISMLSATSIPYMSKSGEKPFCMRGTVPVVYETGPSLVSTRPAACIVHLLSILVPDPASSSVIESTGRKTQEQQRATAALGQPHQTHSTLTTRPRDLFILLSSARCAEMNRFDGGDEVTPRGVPRHPVRTHARPRTVTVRVAVPTLAVLRRSKAATASCPRARVRDGPAGDESE
ncbi:hypothetical protein OH77DRAFT_1002946 [Trametes cingulata]|nr:hypothetical protein OH77DRAFT_1002946 [Trametes cingulata]